MLNILIIQNGYCTPSIDDIINDILHDQKKQIVIIKSYDNHINYTSVEFIKLWDRIIILGGYQSVRNLINFPYLKKVMELIKIAVNLNIPIFGICLGCQLIAKAYGNRVVQMKNIQIGYHPKLNITKDGKLDPIFKDCNDLENVLAFHVDTFIISDNNPIKILAKYDMYPYIINIGSAYGVQFHPEVNLSILRCYLEMKCDILFDTLTKDKVTKYAEINENKIIETGINLIKKWIQQ